MMENTELCKLKIAYNMGYAYNNGSIVSIKEAKSPEDSTIIYLGIFKLFLIDDGSSMDGVADLIGKILFKKNTKKRELTHKNYEKNYFNIIEEGLKKLGTQDCDFCVFGNKRKLNSKDCQEKFTKNKFKKS